MEEKTETKLPPQSFSWKLPKYLTTVTLFSKILAAILFIALPCTGFYLGYKFHEATTLQTSDFQGDTKIIRSATPQTLVRAEETKIPFDNYTNTKYHFSLQYPDSLKNRIDSADNHFSASGAEFDNIFSLEIYPTDKDPISWWKQTAKNIYKYSIIYNIAFNDISIGKLGDIHGKEVVGQTKSPSGESTQPVSILLIPRNGFLLVIEDDTLGYYSKEYPGSDEILNSITFQD